MNRKRAVARILLAGLAFAATLAAQAQESVHYAYDVFGRLVGVCFEEAGTLITYNADAMGNRTEVTTLDTACTAANVPPQAVEDFVSGTFFTFDTVTVDAIANDNEPDGDPLTITDAVCESTGCLVSIENNKLAVTGTSEGPKTVHYTVSDGRGGRDSAQATVSMFQEDPNCGDPFCI